MKTIAVIFIFLLLSIVIYLFILGMKSQSGHAPGLVNDQLSRCPDTPNCVNSEYPEQQDNYISPINILQNSKSNTLPLTTIKNIIQETAGSIQVENENYIAATFTSTIFHFVDDLEIRIDRKQNRIHLRSASRIGRSDLGANLKRVKLIKEKYIKLSDK